MVPLPFSEMNNLRHREKELFNQSLLIVPLKEGKKIKILTQPEGRKINIMIKGATNDSCLLDEKIKPRELGLISLVC